MNDFDMRYRCSGLNQFRSQLAPNRVNSTHALIWPPRITSCGVARVGVQSITESSGRWHRLDPGELDRLRLVRRSQCADTGALIHAIRSTRYDLRALKAR
jgi:hypothetical protein